MDSGQNENQRNQEQGENIMTDEWYKITRKDNLITIQILISDRRQYTFRSDQVIISAEWGLIPAAQASDAELLSFSLQGGF